nr:MAG TPA: hypothetical protein [Caudoviricetes sp.]
MGSFLILNNSVFQLNHTRHWTDGHTAIPCSADKSIITKMKKNCNTPLTIGTNSDMI